MSKSLRLYLSLLFLLILVGTTNGQIDSKIPNPEPKIDKEKEHLDELVRRGIRLDNLTFGSPSYPFYEKIDYEKDKIKRRELGKQLKEERKKMRKLSTSQTLENLGFIDFIQRRDNNRLVSAFKHIIYWAQKEKTDYILYPYPFEYYVNGDNQTKSSSTGGAFTLDDSTLNTRNFLYMKSISSVEISKAKGIYDTDIGILNMDYQVDGADVPLFTETSTYCEFFVNILGKVSSCVLGKEEYLNYKVNYPNKGAVVLLSPQDILNDTLYDSKYEQLKMKLIIIPDYLTGNEETIIKKGFNTAVATVLTKYKSLGGHIIASGKGGYLLEKIGILPSGTYDTSQTLSTKDQDNLNTIYGCEDVAKNTPEEQPDFLKQLLCLGNIEKSHLVQVFPIKNIPSDFESLVKFTNTEKKLVYKVNGRQFDINDESATYDYILLSKGEDKDGRIMLVNGSPVKNAYYISHIRNMILYSMTKEIIYELKVQFSAVSEELQGDLPIPAGEEGVQLNSTFKVYNLFDVDLINVEIDILLANLVDVVEMPKICSMVEDSKFINLTAENMNTKKYLKCVINKLESLTHYNGWFKIEITHYSVTQKSTDIPLMYSWVSYKKGESSTYEETLNPGMYYVQSRNAALLRATINKDPISCYPMKGEGIYFDLILSVENKELTVAKDVNYVAVVPLITPLFGGQTPNSVAHIYPFYEKYYEEHNFTYPWTSIEDRGVDYIDYIELADKGVCYVGDYDTPVKTGMVDRSSVEYKNKHSPTGETKYDEIVGVDKGITAANVMKEIYFSDAESFYEKATGRTQLFIDTHNEKGAQAVYGDNIPADLVDPNNSKRTKRQYAWIRADTFFYRSLFDQYQIPTGLDYTYLLSLDKYPEDGYSKTGKVLGDRKPHRIKQGYYDSTRNKNERLVPGEFANSMLEYEYIQKLDPTVEEDLEKLKNITNNDISLTHYMITFDDINDIQKADSIMGFVLDPNKDDGSGYMEKYPSIKLVFAHSIDVVIKPEQTRLGGMVEIILPNEVQFNDEDPIKEERITTVADNVAFYETKYENNIIYLYFKRGLMPNENYGLPSKCKAYLENLNTKDPFEVTIKIHNLKYDFSNEKFESLVPVPEYTTTTTSTYMPFFSLPCLYIQNRLSRKSSYASEPSNEIYEYELVNPYARYGGYFQELLTHSYIYATKGAYHVRNPGLQANVGGFSIVTNIGTSSVPFAEFLETGELSTPGVVRTSRLDWTDVWGRKWSQNLRTIYPEVPPSPPSPLHFIMTTTYELIDEAQNRQLEWESDETFYIRVQMKVRNTYELYWDPTICLENQVTSVGSTSYTDLSQIDEKDYPLISLSFGNQYGQCYNSINAYLEGRKLDENILTEMDKMMKCSDTLDAVQMTECSKRADELDLPKLKKRPQDINDEDDTSPNHNWNYSPLIENYLPEGYISTALWQLSIGVHLDDAFHKGFPFHLDDCIPNFDNANTKPHDLIAFPIYKGVGYEISYDPNYSFSRYGDYKGWWSDQLQNKDHTLIAGQAKVNEVAVGQESLIKDEDWINVREMYPDNARFKNIYVCKFNQHRVKVTPGQEKLFVMRNVYQNNVIPVLPDLQEDDPRYNQFDCSGENAYQYSPFNISEVNNRLVTSNSRDWLYFAMGLRGNSRENINVLLKLSPLRNNKFEGVTKIQDGGRLTYWEPPCGPNSYDYYDSNVNTVLSKRVDLYITQRIYPTDIYTFNSYGFLLFTIEDPAEKNREYTLNTYMNSHGYGDATVLIYVGGTDGTSCKINAGEFTYVKIVFYNNAGFDWEMTEDAITLNPTGYSTAFNAASLNRRVKNNVEYPSEYKFMSYEIPEEIKDYVTLTPSQHVMDIPSMFFDLTFNNILNIKDALEGDYYYCLNVTKDFPEKYKGKMWEIKMKLNETYFKRVPGHNDPTGNYHDYHLTIPSIKFGVPLTEGEYAGKVFYNIGQAKDLYFNFRFYQGFEYQGIKVVEESVFDQLSAALTDSRTKFDNLLSLWDSLENHTEITDKIKMSSYIFDGFYQQTTVDIKEAYPIFPYEVPQNPYKTSLHFLIKSFAPYVPPGNRMHLGYSRLYYNNGRATKMDMKAEWIRCIATGPSLSPSFEHILVDFKSYDMAENIDFIYDYVQDADTSLYAGDERKLLLTLKARNDGTREAYNANFTLRLENSTILLPLSQTSDAINVTDLGIQDDERIVNVFYQGTILANDEIKLDVYVQAKFGEKIDYDSDTNIRNLDNNNGVLNIVKGISMNLCVENRECKKGDTIYGEQKSSAYYNIEYINGQRSVGVIKIISENKGTELMPIYHLKAEIEDYDKSYNLNDVTYTFYRKIEGKDSIFIPIYQGKDNYYVDTPFKEGEIKQTSGYKIEYKVLGQFPDKRTADSNSLNEITYEKEEEEEKKEEEDKKSIPGYLIAIIVIICLAALAATGFLLYKYVFKKQAVVNDFDPIQPTTEEAVKKKRNLKNTKVINYSLAESNNKV